MEHTPGPWKIIGRDVVAHRDNAPNEFICADVAKVADSRLVAAAPDMLIALHEAEGWLLGWASAEKELEYIQAVIRKAEGK
jgi:hypothetical protein